MLYQMPRLWAPIDGATSAPPVPLVPRVLDQPDQARYARQQAPRYLVSAPRYFDGATQHESYLFAIGQPQIRLSYQIPRAKAPIDVPVAVTQTDIPPFVPQPSSAWFAQRDRARLLGGSPAQLLGLTITGAQTYLFPVSQPDLARESARHALRFVVDAPKALDGATVQPWFVYPVNQPELAYQLPLRRLVPQTGPSPQLLGPFITTSQTYVFPVNQADFAREAAKHAIRFVVDAPRRLDGATVQPTYVFTPNQPEFKYYVRVTPAAPVLPIGGVVLPPQQTYEFAPNQPELRGYLWLEIARRLSGPQLFAYWPTDAAVAPPVRIEVQGSSVVAILLDGSAVTLLTLGGSYGH